MDQTSLLEKAKAHCEAKETRFTPLREKVYCLLLQSNGAVGAYDLLDRLKESEGSAKPATVYRSLDFLLDMGLVHKVESDNTFIACHHFDCQHPVQFLICDECGCVQEIQSTGIKEQLDKQADSQGFKVRTQTIEVHGVCATCR